MFGWLKPRAQRFWEIADIAVRTLMVRSVMTIEDGRLLLAYVNAPWWRLPELVRMKISAAIILYSDTPELLRDLADRRIMQSSARQSLTQKRICLPCGAGFTMCSILASAAISGWSMNTDRITVPAFALPSDETMAGLFVETLPCHDESRCGSNLRTTGQNYLVCRA